MSKIRLLKQAQALCFRPSTKYLSTKAETQEVEANQATKEFLDQEKYRFEKICLNSWLKEKNNFENMVKDAEPPISDKSDLEQKIAYTINKAEMDLQKLKYPSMNFEQMNIKLRRDDAWSYL